MSGALREENASYHGIPFSVDFTHPEDYFIFIYQIVFATCAFLLAGSVTMGILKTRALRNQNRFIFMANTSISDTLTGLSVYYLCVFDVQEAYPSRNGTFFILTSLLGVNVLTFMFAQFDRYCAVCHPFFYSRFISSSLVTGVCVYCWFHVYIQTLALQIVPAAVAVKVYAFSIAYFQIVVVTKIIMNIKLYVVARNQLARDAPSPERENKRESLRIIILVVAVFLILWTPAFVNIVVKQVTTYGIYFRNEATNIFASMARFNAISTSALYIWASPELREAVLHIGWHKVRPQITRYNLKSNSKS
ncbi:G-protein coupled receptor 183-like [Electrophorus electricus]|uniref:G-protein coupled receptor 183-like n=1 Tax=Electrophorus electricus TaxID=8005 RepID=UPI0015CF8F75|nr:G-protein coupled receptor 183-like [Electrophorus electricus]